MERKEKMLKWAGGREMWNLDFMNGAFSWCATPLKRRRRRRAPRVRFRSTGIPQGAFSPAVHAPPFSCFKDAFISFLSRLRLFRSAVYFLLLTFSYLFTTPSFSEAIYGRIVNKNVPVAGAVVSGQVTQQNRNGIQTYALSDTTGIDGGFSLDFDPIAADTLDVVADDLHVSHVYPNPGAYLRGIDVNVAEYSSVKIDIYNAKGQFVDTVFDQRLDPGKHHLRFTVPGIADEFCFARINAGDKTYFEKFTLFGAGPSASGTSFHETRVEAPTITLKNIGVSGRNETSYIVSKLLEKNVMFSDNYDLGNIVVDLVPKNITVSGKGSDVFGTPMGGVEYTAHYNVAGHPDSAIAVSSSDGNVSIDIPIQEPQVDDVFKGKTSIDDVVARSGEHRQKVSGKKPFNSVDLGNVVLRTYTDISGILFDTLFGKDGPALGLIPIEFKNKSDYFQVTTDLLGRFSLSDIPAGSYAVQIGLIADTSRIHIRQTGIDISGASMNIDLDVLDRSTFDPLRLKDYLIPGSSPPQYYTTPYKDMMEIFDILYYRSKITSGGVDSTSARCDKPLTFYVIADTTKDFGRNLFRVTDELIREKLAPGLIGSKFPKGFLEHYVLECGIENIENPQTGYAPGYHIIDVNSIQGVGATTSYLTNALGAIFAAYSSFYRYDTNGPWTQEAEEEYKRAFIHEIASGILGASRTTPPAFVVFDFAIGLSNQYWGENDPPLVYFLLSRDVGLKKAYDPSLRLVVMDRELRYALNLNK